MLNFVTHTFETLRQFVQLTSGKPTYCAFERSHLAEAVCNVARTAYMELTISLNQSASLREVFGP